MNLQQFKDKWIDFVRGMNKRGLPIPTIRDPKTSLGSISLTLLFISFNVWLVSVVGKVAGFLGGMNTNDCFNMFLGCAGLYFGRRFQQSDSGKGSLDKSD